MGVGVWSGASGRWKSGAFLVTALLASGCVQSFELKTVDTPVVERRVPVDADTPLFESDWQLAGERVTGHVAWSSCVDRRTWRTEQRKTTQSRTSTAASAALVVAGLGAEITGLATYDTSAPTLSCTDSYTTFDGAIVVNPDSSCTTHAPDNTTSAVLVASGVITVAIGLLLLSTGPRTETKILHTTPHDETSTLPCIPPSDLPILSLVLKLGEGKFLHVALDANGDASIAVPPGVKLPPNAELPIVVYRVPPGAKRLLRRWQVIGVVHTPPAE